MPCWHCCLHLYFRLFCLHSFLSLPFPSFPCFALLCFALRCVALLCFALLCFALLCFALRCFTLRFVAFLFVCCSCCSCSALSEPHDLQPAFGRPQLLARPRSGGQHAPVFVERRLHCGARRTARDRSGHVRVLVCVGMLRPRHLRPLHGRVQVLRGLFQCCL